MASKTTVAGRAFIPARRLALVLLAVPLVMMPAAAQEEVDEAAVSHSEIPDGREWTLTPSWKSRLLPADLDAHMPAPTATSAALPTEEGDAALHHPRPSAGATSFGQTGTVGGAPIGGPTGSAVVGRSEGEAPGHTAWPGAARFSKNAGVRGEARLTFARWRALSRVRATACPYDGGV